MKTIKQLLEGKKDFEPHMMYDPKTGKGYKAEKPEDHERMKKMGYSHDKPEIKEDFNIGAAFFGSMLLALAPFYYIAGKAYADDLKALKAKSAKKGFKPSKEDQSLLQKFIAMVKRKKPDAVSKAMKKANESVELDEGIDPKKEYGASFVASVKSINKQRKLTKELGVKLKEVAKSLGHSDSGNGLTPDAVKSNPKWKAAKKALDVAFKKEQQMNQQMNKVFGKQMKDFRNKDYKAYRTLMREDISEAKSSSGYELYHRDFSGAMQHAYAHAKKKGFIVDKDDVDHKVAMGPKRPSSGKTNKYILDTNKKQKLHVQVANLDNKRYELNMYIESVEDFDLDFFLENARAKRDAMSAMGKRGKDSADIDTDATDDDRKAASKNVLMQIRKLSDLPKGGEIEFEGGKKGKISQDDATKVVKMFNTLKKPQDKAKFQKVISKDLRTIQGLLKRLGR